MRRGVPVPVLGDGTSLWTLTHTRDFAVAFVGLLGDRRAVGDTFHITSDEVLTWAQITRILARAAGAPEPTLVPLPGWGHRHRAAPRARRPRGRQGPLGRLRQQQDQGAGAGVHRDHPLLAGRRR